MLKQQLSLKLSQKLSPQQIQLMKLIQLPTQQFEQRIMQEMEENPALEGGKEDDFEDIADEFDNEDTYDEENDRIDTEDINIDDYLSDDDIPDYKLQANNYSADDEEKHIPYAAGKTFTEYLQDQLSTVHLELDEEDIAYFLVGS